MAKAVKKAATKAASPAKAAAAPKPTLEIFDCEQGSDEWMKLRLGLVTASNFNKVLAEGDGKTRDRYMRDLAGEILTGIPAESFENAAMRRGREMEAEAREQYARMNFVELRQVGLVKNSGLMKYATVGCSPDALVDTTGGLECKSMLPALLIARIEKGTTFPSEHKAQVQGCMWVCEREWWDVKLFYPGMPSYVVRAYRDETFIKNLSNAVEVFSYDLKKLVQRLRDMGGGQ